MFHSNLSTDIFTGEDHNHGTHVILQWIHETNRRYVTFIFDFTETL